MEMMQETQVQSLGQEDPLEKEMATQVIFLTQGSKTASLMSPELAGAFFTTSSAREAQIGGCQK